MIYNIKEIMLGLFAIYNNATGVCIAAVTLVVGVVLCRFTNLKFVMICVGICFFMLVLGVLATLIGNTPDNLWMPIVFFPVFVVLTVVCTIYYTIKFILSNRKKNKNSNQ